MQVFRYIFTTSLFEAQIKPSHPCLLLVAHFEPYANPFLDTMTNSSHLFCKTDYYPQLKITNESTGVLHNCIT